MPETQANPYLNAQRTWNSHVGSLIASRLIWQATAIIALLVVLASVGGIIYIGSQSKFVPYVIEVNKLGESAPVAPAALAAKVDSRIVRAGLGEFVVNARSVSADIALQRKAIIQVYSMLPAGGAAAKKMDEYLNGNPDANPFKRAANELVNIDIVSAIPQSKDTWQIDWIENVRSRKGELLAKPSRMRALLTVRVGADGTRNEEQFRANPLGIYITDFSWARQF
jgi:type IV secretion system protein VirB5